MSSRPLNPDLWNVLHDGSIDSISGSVPGEISLSVGISYLRDLFEDPGESIAITLHDCTRISFKDADRLEAIEDIAAISALELGILSTEVGHEVFCSHRHGGACCGTLSIVAAGFSLSLDTGRPIELEDLFAAAETYWTCFSNPSS